MTHRPGFAIEIVHGDALAFQADVLMLKYAPLSSGLDRVVLKKLGHEDIVLQHGEARVLPVPTEFGTSHILMVGTVSMQDINYEAIRELGHNMLANLKEVPADIKHVLTTAHGVSTNKRSLDEEEALRSLLLGFADAAEAGHAPASLERITVIERNEHRAELFEQALHRFLPEEDNESLVTDEEKVTTKVLAGVSSFESTYQKPVADGMTPHAFVAMPFAEEFDDQYYLAIRPAVTANNILCVRLDQEEAVFTGDIMEQVKERIRTAKLVVALLDRRNPNVYLEVGYAWGVETPTILILHEDEEPPFDVQSARLLTYRRIHRLKDQLTEELRYLL